MTADIYGEGIDAQPFCRISGLLNLERDDTPCMHASTTVSWKVTAPRHEATLCALAFTRPQPIAAHPHLARTLEGRRGPDRRAPPSSRPLRRHGPLALEAGRALPCLGGLSLLGPRGKGEGEG